jgi:hypothetical protein
MKGGKLWGKEMEDRWAKLEEIVRRVIGEELDARGIKAKNKLTFAGGRWLGVTADQLEAWSAAYPSCDVQTELKKAAAWIVSNPAMAPKSQFGRFLNTWLSRQQNVSSIRAIPTRNDQVQEQRKFCAYCDKPRTGVVNMIPHCQAHALDAMDGKPARAA